MDETITRSYDRKVNLGNYESAGFFASETVTVPEDATIIEKHHISEDLFAKLKAEVETQVAEARITTNPEAGDWEAFKRVLTSTSEFKPANMEDFQKLTIFQQGIINEVKKAYKRSPEYKNRKSTTDVENERGRK